jgi:hypothetical protein
VLCRLERGGRATDVDRAEAGLVANRFRDQGSDRRFIFDDKDDLSRPWL